MHRKRHLSVGVLWMLAVVPDPRFIEAITTNPELETVFLNMHAAGLAVSLKIH